MEKKYLLYGGLACLVILFVIGIAWFFFFRPTTPPATNDPSGSLGIPLDNVNNPANNPSSNTNSNNTVENTGQTSESKIFQITAGPIVGATLIQTLRPTTTLARYIKQENGHVFDLPLDVPGAVPRVVSNVTIPSGQRALWVEGGAAAIMQYVDEDVVKSVYLGFPPATTTVATLPTRIVFLPDAIIDIAASPDGKSVAYLLKTSTGSDGYIAKADGTASKKIFSLPLSQVLISWPSTGTLLAQTKPATGAPGIIFSIDAKSGVATPLVYAQGITATADPKFSRIIYQTSSSEAGQISLARNIKSSIDAGLAFNPPPEKCTWSLLATSTAYCASQLGELPVNYLDLWHLGAMSQPDTILSFNLESGKMSVVASPGSKDGGVRSDVLELSLSPNEKYLSFTTKGNRALWGVRLGQ